MKPELYKHGSQIAHFKQRTDTNVFVYAFPIEHFRCTIRHDWQNVHAVRSNTALKG